MSEKTTVQKIKDKLRITHTHLDGDIEDDISAAIDEMIRVGVAPSIADDVSKPLILKAIKTYCLASNAHDITESEKYINSFKHQIDDLRKSAAYNTEPEADSDGE